MFVVDECSSDGSAAAVREAFPQVVLIDDPSDRGYGHANNLGLRRCSGRFVVTLNPDTEVPPDAFCRLIAWMDAHPEVGVVGPKLVRPDGSLDLACRRTFPTPLSAAYHYLGLARRFPKNPRFARYNLTYLDPGRAAEVDSVSGAFMLVRRDAAQRTNFFDEDYFMYGEDLDWAYRIKQAGWKVIYQPDVVVLHHKGRATRQRSTRMIIEFHRAMVIFYRKHYAERQPIMLSAMVVCVVALRTMLALARNALRPRDERRVA